jgi:hypothetical protein
VSLVGEELKLGEMGERVVEGVVSSGGGRLFL